jgi:hypothetical protein
VSRPNAGCPNSSLEKAAHVHSILREKAFNPFSEMIITDNNRFALYRYSAGIFKTYL